MGWFAMSDQQLINMPDSGERMLLTLNANPIGLIWAANIFLGSVVVIAKGILIWIVPCRVPMRRCLSIYSKLCR
jgi:hypothetical protein